MPGGGKKQVTPEDSAGPSWARAKSGKELRDPKSLFQPDPHPLKVQMARQASSKGDPDTSARPCETLYC